MCSITWRPGVCTAGAVYYPEEGWAFMSQGEKEEGKRGRERVAEEGYKGWRWVEKGAIKSVYLC